MSNISIYLSQSQKEKLDILAKNGLATELENQFGNLPLERSRSALISMMVEQEYTKLIEAQMVADAVIIDEENLGWDEEEQLCQITDSETFG